MVDVFSAYSAYSAYSAVNGFKCVVPYYLRCEKRFTAEIAEFAENARNSQRRALNGRGFRNPYLFDRPKPV